MPELLKRCIWKSTVRLIQTALFLGIFNPEKDGKFKNTSSKVRGCRDEQAACCNKYVHVDRCFDQTYASKRLCM